MYFLFYFSILLLPIPTGSYKLLTVSPREPIFAAINRKEINIRPKLAMITLLQSRSATDYDDETYLHMTGHSMLAYRPQASIPMNWPQRRDAVHQLLSAILPCFHPRHPNIAKILNGSVFFFYEGNILRCLMGSVEGGYRWCG
jgi:hypothetical protein